MADGHEQTDEAWVIRAQEEITGAEARWRGAGLLRARKRVDVVPVSEELPRGVEEIDWERVPVVDGDSGEVETLPDGTISIPVYEEELLVTKRTVLKERVLIRKETQTELVRIEDELRREHVEINADPGLEIHDER